MSDLCKFCKNLKYSEKYDAYYCIPCNKWAEKKCSDKKCEFCSIRPTSPICTFGCVNVKE